MEENSIVRPEFRLFPPNRFSYSTLLLISNLIFNLYAPRFVLVPDSHLCFALLAAHFLGRLAHFLAYAQAAYTIKKHSTSS
jgi:hypothetical protein